MRWKALLKQLLFLVAFGGLVFSFSLFFYFFPRSSVGSDSVVFIDNTLPTPNPEQVSSGLPVRLTIPKIKVDTTIEHVNLAPDGAMDVPKSFQNVAWFELGHSPGEDGSAVIAGHYGRKDGKPSAFDDLYKLRKGDLVYVEDDKGLTTSFVVRENRRYDPKADSSGVFNSDDGKSHLNLITCEGTWNEGTQQYSKRLVVFADKE